jgi:hypothetical protein
MSEEPPITRRELDARFDALNQAIASQKESVTIAMAAADRAVTKAEVAVEKRFENSNEWRNTVETLQRTYLPRTEFDQARDTLSDKIAMGVKRTDDLTKRLDDTESHKQGGADLITRLFAIIAAIAAISALFLRVASHWSDAIVK